MRDWWFGEDGAILTPLHNYYANYTYKPRERPVGLE